jgi:prevent-host-death family protein
VETITAQTLRDGWRNYREAAHFDDKNFVVTYFDIPLAGVLSPRVWRRRLKRVPHGDRCREIGVRQSRIELRRLLDHARDGNHIIVTKHGDENAVIVPYDWLRSALPELFKD